MHLRLDSWQEQCEVGHDSAGWTCWKELLDFHLFALIFLFVYISKNASKEQHYSLVIIQNIEEDADTELWDSFPISVRYAN